MARVSRSKDERVTEIDAKIAKKKEEIAALEAKKDAILNPKKPITMKAVLSKAKENGLTPDEVAKKLGIKIEE